MGRVKTGVLEILQQMHCTSQLARPSDNRCAYKHLSLRFSNLWVCKLTCFLLMYLYLVNLFTVEEK